MARSETALNVERLAAIRRAVGCPHQMDVRGVVERATFEFRHEGRLYASLVYNGRDEYDHEPFYAALEAGLRVECSGA